MTEQNPTSPQPSGQPNPEQPAPQPYVQPYQQPYAQQPYQQPYAQPYANQYSPQYAPAYPAVPTNSMAVVALIAGIAGWTLLPFVGSIVAVITGPMAKKQIAQTGEQGSGMASAGIILGWIAIGLTAIGILIFVLFFGLFAAAVSTSSY